MIDRVYQRGIMMQNMKFPWSDNWWIEGDKAWFCGGEINALFCMDMNSGQCDLIARIPECDFRGFRVYSYCIKSENMIFCLPGIASNIWCYDLKKEDWEKTEVGNKNQLCAFTNIYRQSSSSIWLLEDMADRIFELDLKRKIVKKEYSFLANESEFFDGGILVKNELYGVVDNKVFCVNTKQTDIKVYEIAGIKSALATICYDGHNFWISSFCKEIYIWNPKQGIVKTLTEFPNEFGIYNLNTNCPVLVDYDSLYSTGYPLFVISLDLGKYIWHIPLHSDEILYIDKESYKIEILEIEGEQETKESLQRDFKVKYLVQYIREDRYIGLYSFKRQLIFEIDTESLCVKNRNYELSDQAFLAIAQADGYYDGRRMFRERNEKDQIFFSALLSVNDKKKNNFSQSVGRIIYHALDE